MHGTVAQKRRSSNRLRSLIALALLVVLIVTAALIVDVRDLCAHSPHDPIDALAISPAYAQDETLFVVISDHLLRSEDGGSSWKELVNGLDNKHLFSSIAIAPSYRFGGTLFVSSKGDGIYRSQDGGDSWVKVNDGLSTLEIVSLSIYPGDQSDRIVLAAGAKGGLAKTKDGGDSWYQVLDDSVRVTAIAFSPDLNKDLVIAGDDRGMLYLSTDNGELWQQTWQFSDAGAITSIAISPIFSSDGTFFVGTEKGGILRTVDSGASFVEVNDGLRFTIRGKYGSFRKSKDGPIIRRDEKDIISVAISPNYGTDSTVLTSMWNEAVFKSEDGGNTWKKYSLDLTCDYQADSEMYRSPHFRDLKLSRTFAVDGTVFLGGFDGLFKSTDGGRRWMQMETFPLGLIRGLSLSPGDKNNLSCAVTSYGGGIYTTEDQGITWTIGNKGLNTTRISDIVYSPRYHSDSTIFSASRGFLLKSTDGGQSWNTTSLKPNMTWRAFIYAGLQKIGLPTFFWKPILTEAEREKPFATQLALSPNFPSDNTIFFGTRLHGVFKSVDGGLSASQIWDGMGQPVKALVISPDFPSDRTLFAGLRGMGIYKTVDGGDTWQPANNGLTFLEAWRQSPTYHQIAAKDIVLVISPHYETDKTVFAASSEGLFKTTDEGQSWQELETLSHNEDSYVLAMAISPNYENDAVLFASVRGKGLFKTADGGATFARIGSGLFRDNHSISYIVLSESYATDKTLYAASEEQLFRSTDDGDTWTMIARPVRYENMRDVIRYEGAWTISGGDDLSARSVSYSSAAHDKAILDFVGTGVSWIGTVSNDQGVAQVYVDGDLVGEVDQFSDTRKTLVKSYSITDLAYGPHTIVVEVTGAKNPKSQGHRIEVDAFDIAP